MNILNPGVQYIAIYDPTNEESVVIDGNQVGPGSELTKETLSRGVNARGGVNHLNERWDLNLEFADGTAYNALNALPKQRSYQMTIVLLNGFVFWTADQRFALDERAFLDPESEDYPFTLRMVDIRPSQDVYQVLNAAAPWYDLDGDGIADKYSISGTTTAESFTSSAQSLTGAVDFALVKTIYLPVEGVGLEFGVTFNELHPDENEIALVYRDITGTILSTDSQSVTSAGRATFSSTTPSNVYSVDVEVVSVSATQTGTVEIEAPALRLDNSDFYNG
jgi:hypothetical protein